MTDPQLAYFDPGDGRRIAYKYRPADRPEPLPTIVFLPGYASDMEGTKALMLDSFARDNRLGMLRFDYSGCGASGGDFAEGTLERWVEEVVAITDALAPGRLMLVGSSMGGWIALHLALRRPDRIQSLVGIAAAPDFTDWGFAEEEKAAIRRDGRLERANPYGPEPSVTHRGFFESGESLRLLGGPIDIIAPVRLIHGIADAEVPVDVALRLALKLRSSDVHLTLIKGGGHRLSEPHELDVIMRAAGDLLETRR